MDGAQQARRVEVIDSHTAGEPTRVVTSGGPELGSGTVAARARALVQQHDDWRRGVVLEPRGHDAIVGALLLEPSRPDAVAGVVFFNNVGLLGMCVHGTIGVVVTLAHLGRIEPGAHMLETPAGDVGIFLQEGGLVTVDNVTSYRHAAGVVVDTERHGMVTGDIAYGGNWFFLIEEHDQILELTELRFLTDFTWDVRRSLARAGITGADGAEIDHIELFSSAVHTDADSRNFVLCPGGAYDRSPCGTGTSARLACLHADGRLPAGRVWRQEGIAGGVFMGSVREAEGGVLPTIGGTAFVTGLGTLLFDPLDPLRDGVRT